MQIVLDAVDVQILEAKCRREGCQGEDRDEEPQLGQHVWWCLEAEVADAEASGVVWISCAGADAFHEKCLAVLKEACGRKATTTVSAAGVWQMDKRGHEDGNE